MKITALLQTESLISMCFFFSNFGATITHNHYPVLHRDKKEAISFQFDLILIFLLYILFIYFITAWSAQTVCPTVFSGKGTFCQCPLFLLPVTNIHYSFPRFYHLLVLTNHNIHTINNIDLEEKGKLQNSFLILPLNLLEFFLPITRTHGLKVQTLGGFHPHLLPWCCINYLLLLDQ